MQAGTVFCDREFQQEVQSGKVQSTSVDKVTCVALAGVVGEYVKYGYAEGGLNDITQIDQLMRALQVSNGTSSQLLSQYNFEWHSSFHIVFITLLIHLNTDALRQS